MQIVTIVFMVLAVLMLAAMAFFMFCIWRAIIGKSSVDLRLNTTLGMHAKKLDNLGSKMDSNTIEQGKLATQMKLLARSVSDALKKDKSDEGDR